MNINDFTQRQLALLPPWFGETIPLLLAALQGSAYVNNFIYSIDQYLRNQMRLQTMTGPTLDLFAQDYFGKTLLRHFGESDDTYRTRISASLLPPGATRQAMVDVLTKLTGRAPIIWEAWSDGSFYNYSFYNNDSYGSSNAAYQAWIIVFRPMNPASEGLSYYSDDSYYNNTYYGGLDTTGITDQDILAAIERTKVKGTLIHTTILD